MLFNVLLHKCTIKSGSASCYYMFYTPKSIEYETICYKAAVVSFCYHDHFFL